MTAFTCSHNLTHLRGGRRIGEGCVRISVNVGMREREKDKTKRRREETEEAEERSRKKIYDKLIGGNSEDARARGVRFVRGILKACKDRITSVVCVLHRKKKIFL